MNKSSWYTKKKPEKKAEILKENDATSLWKEAFESFKKQESAKRYACPPDWLRPHKFIDPCLSCPNNPSPFCHCTLPRAAM